MEGYGDAELPLHAVCEVEGHRPWIVVAEVGNPGMEYVSDGSPGMEYVSDGSDEREVPERYR